MWTVYDSPSDYPGQFVARLFEVDGDGPRATGSMVVADDIEKLRNMFEFEMGLVKLMRSPEDDPVIVETWL
jgi:hypothetical protein